MTKRGCRDGRQQEMVELLRRRGYVAIEQMAARFGVSQQTVRRDIKRLASLGLVQRYHGGAGLPEDGGPLAYPVRKTHRAAEKRLIGALVARSIPHGASLFLDIGTTMEAVAEALLGHEGLRVVTNNLGAADVLAARNDFEIIVPGGQLRRADRAIIGELTSDFLRRFKVGYGVFGIGTIDDDGELLDYNYRDVHVTATAMAMSRRRLVAMDHSKFEADAMVRVCHLSDIDALFTDRQPPSAIAALLEAHEVALHLPAPAPATTVHPPPLEHHSLGG